jgi:hypothetical protein
LAGPNPAPWAELGPAPKKMKIEKIKKQKNKKSRKKKVYA